MKTLLIIIAILLTVSCSTDDTPSQESLLPPITMTGENTFGCLIDGKFFRPRDGTGTFNSEDRGLKVIGGGNQSIEFDATDFKSNKTASILIHLEDLIQTGEGSYRLDSSNGLRGLDGNSNNYMHCIIWDDNLQSYQQYLSYDESGIVLITKLDVIQNVQTIWSGTFQGSLVRFDNRNDTIRVSLGRFDLKTPQLSSVSFP
ncbi:hypothetical protein [Nonlabens ulvanivorans]|uniref:Uncharacterized protein n=1 Tax=Nonlabens ulvanivorans TaxID=906888 RepID=A0A084JUV2_NONUL|nr:hypothetical protein [Nonlabens ulvanivorans]KEZ92736.1 hypothetical protein IL45_11395 [Nonlabens ulvanivorans]PRX15583.1 hypothetical protein LY02_00803 [Nonlabens ulvanivorans]